MKGYLSQNKIDYVLFHLGMNIKISADIIERIVFVKNSDQINESGKIVFPLSENSLDLNDIVYKQNLPVLFPVMAGDDFYHIERNSLVFHDDLIKSVFYLLSGYQELDPKFLDPLGRYPYELSIQKELDICGKPLVNYYFEKIGQGISEFLRLLDKTLEKIKYYENFCFFLSHDVDRIDTYTLSEVGYRMKQTLGLAGSPMNRVNTFRITMKYMVNYLNFLNRSNPQWDFQYHIELERKYGFTSSYYFLPRGLKHQDAYYSFGERRIKQLFSTLDLEHCEIGLHGTVRSATEERSFFENYSELSRHIGRSPQGVRQHRLMFDMRETPRIHHNAGMAYDTSLGFAEHEGFRNSYCLPFRLYDHANDKTLETWEIPMMVMDATLFYYRKHEPVSARESLEGILKEVRRFNGIFSLLWHNGYFDEMLYPGIRQFYVDLLEFIHDSGAESMTGIEIINRIESKGTKNNG